MIFYVRAPIRVVLLLFAACNSAAKSISGSVLLVLSGLWSVTPFKFLGSRIVQEWGKGVDLGLTMQDSCVSDF